VRTVIRSKISKNKSQCLINILIFLLRLCQLALFFNEFSFWKSYGNCNERMVALTAGRLDTTQLTLGYFHLYGTGRT